MSCVLDDPSLPISGEANHKIGDCYCYMCTCGNHKCPSNTDYKKNSPNIYYTAYRTAYLKKVPSTSSPFVREGQLLHSKQKMDMVTNHREDFKPTDDLSKPPEANRPNSTSPFKFYSTSTYQSSFPDWKDYSPKVNKIPSKSSRYSLKFTGVSTYEKDFPLYKGVRYTAKRSSKSPSIVSGQEWETGKTTHQASYIPYKVKPPKKYRHESHDVKIIENYMKNISTYQQFYLPHVSPTRFVTRRQLDKVK